MKLLRRLRAFFRKDTLDREMAEEMRHHLEQQTETNLAAGMNPDEARYAAQKSFGGVEQIKERARDQRGWRWLDELAQDLRYGLRQLRKTPGFAAVAIATLTLGIGTTTAIFSVVNSVILRPLPFPQPEELVSLRQTNSRHQAGMVKRGAYVYCAEHAASLSGLAALRQVALSLGTAGDATTIYGSRVTVNYFSVLGVPPALGRDFHSDESSGGRDKVVLLTHQFWVRQLGSRPDVLQQTLRLDDELYSIIGVLPPNPQLDIGAVFVPLVSSPGDAASFRVQDNVEVIGRIKPDITLEQAVAEMDVLAKALGQARPEQKDWGMRISPLLDDMLSHSAYLMTNPRALLFPILGASGFLLLIACVNVANLLLARATTRRKEVAVRATLGASRGRIARQFFCESLLLAGFAGGLGILLAYGSVQLSRSLLSQLPRSMEIAVDGRALAFSCGATLLTALAFGLIPALRAANVDLNTAIKTGGNLGESRAARRLRSGLITAEFALALVLVTGAGLLVHSFVRLQQVDLGFQPEGVYGTRLVLTAKKYSTAAPKLALAGALVTRLESMPEVLSAALATGMPIFGTGSVSFTIAGQPPPPPTGLGLGTLYSAVTPRYFKTMGIVLRRGRDFTTRDTADAPRVLLISEAAAQTYFPGQDPIGQRLLFLSSPEIAREIVGVVSDVRQWGPTTDLTLRGAGYLYEPFAQNPGQGLLMLIVKTSPGAAQLPVAVRNVVHAEDPDLPLSNLYKLTDGVNASVAQFRISTTLFSFFSGIALLLSAVGIYGVVAFNVAQRTSEFGIRLALGAESHHVRRLVLAQVGRWIGAGLILGLAGAIATTRLLRSLLFQVSHYDPLTFVLIALLLTTIALLACWLPAWRATKVDPLVALRHE